MNANLLDDSSGLISPSSRNFTESTERENDSKKEPFVNARIVVADDQLINIEVLRQHIDELGMSDTCDYCINGQQTIDTVKSLVNSAIENRIITALFIQPVDLLLLDFQMPQKNGLQVVSEIK